MTTYVFDIPAFRVSYPAFANSTTYPNVTLQSYWDSAICYISDQDYGWLAGDCRYKALTLMTAHLAAIADLIARGQVPNLMQSATIDKITVSLTPPPLKTQWQWWLSLTGYGQQLYALLQANSTGGFYVGGLPELSAFRKVGGLF